jgi:aminoglycoside 6-adenylyltransferase
VAEPLRHPSLETTEAHIVRWCEAHDFVRAAIVTSTRAVANAPIDKFSDLDVIFMLTDIAPLVEDRGWLSDFGDVLAAWHDQDALKRDPPRTCWVTQFADGSKIDITLWPVGLLRHVVTQSGTLPDQLDVGYRVLVDKDGLTNTLRPASLRAHIPSRPSREAFLALIEDFFLESTYVAKHLWRDDLMPAKFSLDHVMKQGDLRTLLEWRIEIDHDWSLKPGASGKGLKRLLSADLYRSLEQTYVGARIEENWTALFETLALFRTVGVDVAEHFGYQYPRELDDRVTAYLRRVQADANR